MQLSDARAKAQILYDARRTRVAIAPFTDAEPALNMTDGYAIQRELVSLLLADGDRIVGHKVGATSKAMQQLVGLDSPDYGPVLASTVFHDGDVIALDQFIAPKVEAEIAFVLGTRLQGPGVTDAQARAAIAEVVGAMEIVDSRIADWRIKLADTVADLASNGAIVVGERRVPGDGIDFRDIAMTLSRGQTLVDSGSGEAVLGDPVTVLTWLANVLGADGVALEPGHLIMTGALHAAVPLAPGETYTAEYDLLGSVTVTAQ
ncbi:MAG TPA: fumarylacetoacetate hydrolase family protein [Frankiaceae bacterium]|jgi:2-keto-4-pentenoate hydratase|nr:fumarylacetoacetate hydrolase family protein [Frankiaceae bacterium]